MLLCKKSIRVFYSRNMQIDFIDPVPALAHPQKFTIFAGPETGMTRGKDSCKKGTYDLGPVVKPQDDKGGKT